MGIIRVSGSITPAIAQAVLGILPAPRHAQYAKFRADDGREIDAGLAIFFPAPHSYTGEDVLELHAHGGPVVLESLLARVLELGARRAQPGEFTLRAYQHGKLDLAQAEAVADLINAGTEAAARAAQRSLAGEFSLAVHALQEALTALRAYVEAAIDFPAEELDFLDDAALRDRLAQLRAGFEALAARTRQGRLLNEGMTVVIAGAPNAGKSTLLNRLAGHDAAIVTDTPGTTRDLIRERIALDGLPLHIVDTAGLRAASDAVEAEGVRRALAVMTRADRVLFLIDAAADPVADSFARERGRLPAGVPVTVVWNKLDLLAPRAAAPGSAHSLPGAAATLAISAYTGAGLPELRAHLKVCLGYAGGESDALSARARHTEALALARGHVDAAATQLLARRAGELVAEELRAAQQALGAITGEMSSEELLGRIFAGFCIGK